MTPSERDKLARECCAENAPRLLATIRQVQTALAHTCVNTGAHTRTEHGKRS
jgi:hypothetical protein